MSAMASQQIMDGGLLTGVLLDSQKAELIGRYVRGWLWLCGWHTPGCEIGGIRTWIIFDGASQPDVYLGILPEFGLSWRSAKRIPR